MEQLKAETEKDEERKYPPRKYIPPNKIAGFFNGVKNFFGIIALLLGGWTALVTAFVIGPNLVTLKYVDGYQPATFTIKQIHYVERTIRTGGPSRNELYADGIVNGNTEKFFGMGDYVRGTINSKEQIENQIHVGQKLEVLYNPDIPEKNQRNRVVYPEKDFKEYWKGFQQRRLRETYYPLGATLLLCLVFGIAARNIIGAIGFIVGSLFMVLLVLIPTAFNLIS
jgi:hypothetical protein